MPISVKYDDAEFRRVLEQIAEAGANPRPVLKGIGEILQQSIKQRFKDSKAPDGTPWAENTAATLQAYLAKFSGAYTKSGQLSKRGQTIAAKKKPLIGETKSLSTQIYKNIIGEAELAVGSPLEYAAMQQYGGKKADFPHLWGDIPARPFLGLSAEDREDVLDELTAFLDRALGG
jgi:phage virion morphogenesis protein